MFTANPQAPTERPGEAEARAEVFAQAMHQMGYEGMNVGLNDLALGLEPLRKVARSNKLPLLSANLYELRSGKPAFQRLLVKDTGLLKVGVFGLMTRAPSDIGKYVTDQGLEIRDPVASAKAVVAELKGQGCQLVVMMSQLSRQETELVMEKVPGIALALGSTGMELSMQLTAMGQGYFVDAFTKGKYIGEIAVAVGAKKDRYFAKHMRDSLTAERSDLAQQVQGLQSQLDAANRPGAPMPLSPEIRKIMERQMATTRARLQAATMKLEGEVTAPKDASTLDLTMASLGNEIPFDPEIDAKVKKLQEKFPKIGGH